MGGMEGVLFRLMRMGLACGTREGCRLAFLDIWVQAYLYD